MGRTAWHAGVRLMGPACRSPASHLNAVPPHTILGVLERNATPAKLFADVVSPGEVSASARILAFGDQALDLVRKPRLLCPRNIEMCIDVIDQRQQLPASGLVDTVIVERGIGLPDELKDQAHPLRQIEVVVQRIAIPASNLRDPIHKSMVVHG
jgi:hypothetical protein